MDPIDKQLYHKKLVETLSSLHGLSEAESMAGYYFDAKKALGKEIDASLFDEELKRLQKGEPVQYVTGLSFFYGYEFFLNNEVLIPRAETEELVYWAISDFKNKNELNVLDIGSGSGCILATALLELEEAKGEAWDISHEALDCANSNIEKYQLSAQTKLKDVLNLNWENQDRLFDIVFCNPPYILESEVKRMDSHVHGYEPHIALFVDGEDPLVFYKQIIRNLNSILKSDGAVYFETSDLYHDELEAFIKSTRYSFEFKRDMQGKWRMLKIWK